jgi:hypothetical protein
MLARATLSQGFEPRTTKNGSAISLPLIYEIVCWHFAFPANPEGIPKSVIHCAHLPCVKQFREATTMPVGRSSVEFCLFVAVHESI